MANTLSMRFALNIDMNILGNNLLFIQEKIHIFLH